MAQTIPSLYLITPPLEQASSLAQSLEAALDAGVTACVLVRCAVHDEGSAKKIIRTLAPLAVERGAAILLEGEAQWALRSGADGVHINSATGDRPAPLDEAIAKMKPDYIVGVGRVKTRDEAMSFGEKEIDYLLIGEPEADGFVPDFARTLERVSWWADIFNVPVVGFAQSGDEIAALVRAGSDFIALSDFVWNDPEGPDAGVRKAMAVIEHAYAKSS
jgi:thiamine-phosphate pyrophosphorylase